KHLIHHCTHQAGNRVHARIHVKTPGHLCSCSFGGEFQCGDRFPLPFKIKVYFHHFIRSVFHNCHDSASCIFIPVPSHLAPHPFIRTIVCIFSSSIQFAERRPFVEVL